MTPRRLIVADAGLTGPAGHHLGYSQAVAEAALRAGIVPLVLAGRSFSGRIAGGAVPFRAPFTARYQNSGGNGRLRRLLFHGASYLPGPLAGMVAPPLRALRRRIREGQPDAFAAELTDALVAEETGPCDAVLLHSVSAANLHGMLEAEILAGRLWVVLRRMPGEMDLDDAAPEPIMVLLRRLAGRFGERLVLFADTGSLAAIYAHGTGLPVFPVPLPVVVPPTRQESLGHPPHVVFAGGARAEKGYHHLPKAIATMRRRARFTLQSGVVGPGDDPLIQRAHRQLRRMAGLDLVLIERALDPSDYFDLLNSADLLCLPYDGLAYGMRSSGIVAEALALGVPSIVPADCWMAEVAGLDVAVHINAQIRLGEALDTALARLDDMTAVARGGAPAWRDAHNPDKLLKTLINPHISYRFRNVEI